MCVLLVGAAAAPAGAKSHKKHKHHPAPCKAKREHAGCVLKGAFYRGSNADPDGALTVGKGQEVDGKSTPASLEFGYSDDPCPGDDPTGARSFSTGTAAKKIVIGKSSAFARTFDDRINSDNGYFTSYTVNATVRPSAKRTAVAGSVTIHFTPTSPGPYNPPVNDCHRDFAMSLPRVR
jgi:hypothetical protein